ncbi:hypothetical protein IDH44_23555 [Paenibacillus sp. IB182496]|uniref:Uncharacterized protein n=1 Tax=Paenibacillus sabuli TaxID=2772509 RepID=A0A927BZK0_9BACL|nr:hypothetical protein [Paenibacillus sabuli]MBD2848183.1 hypothetical protein [Paenibacillus sabuli]
MEMIPIIGLLGAMAGLWYGRRRWSGFQWTTDALALLAVAAVTTIAASSVLRALVDRAVFLTQVHEVLLHPGFLAGGGYLGAYAMTILLERLQAVETRSTRS